MWPKLTTLYQLHPWDLERLSVAELNSYMQDIKERERAAEREKRIASRPKRRAAGGRRRRG